MNSENARCSTPSPSWQADLASEPMASSAELTRINGSSSLETTSALVARASIAGKSTSRRSAYGFAFGGKRLGDSRGRTAGPDGCR